MSDPKLRHFDRKQKRELAGCEAKDSERLLGKTKKRKIKENAALGESVDAHKSISEIEKRPSTRKGKDVERILFKNKKRKKKMTRASDESTEVFESPSEFEKGCKIQKGMDGEWLSVKTKKRRIKEHKTSDPSIGACESPSEFEKGSKTLKGRRSEKICSLESSIHSETLNETDSFREPEVTSNELKTKARKFKKNCKHKKKQLTKVQEINIEEIQRVVDAEKVDEISLVGDDCTRGMKKWLIQYKESRPGLKVLQKRIDEFVTAHEERQEQERKEREARAAEDGWTVVVHQKGRKKTTDAETGTVMGSVASAAVMDKMSKKKSKEIALDFYRFQKREAKRNEVMMLQRKFEQDKKRIQQLRAARKFRPS
ncbi:uncharacterized protein LOC110101953 isoform X2 [Dendrobium catenatum]|uniref:Ribosomal RNA-processing protein 7 C-terminal domain-containing protein n=1 Tax=Dendrobium catenatum TaxID=906689 RepID=A0A2I0X6X3_9ASPA|nr:uncharacterized protein LOC110101953 isoform X2 [Dendrobium catenatum]PKU83663.1 hypothetical protein MA16_Dca010056 [Dendrobium catenatum]